MQLIKWLLKFTDNVFLLQGLSRSKKLMQFKSSKDVIYH